MAAEMHEDRLRSLTGNGAILGLLCAMLAGCGGVGSLPASTKTPEEVRLQSINQVMDDGGNTEFTAESENIFDLLSNNDEPERTIGVNRYIWAASLDVLSFLPLEGADPFSGVIVTGWGRVAGDATPFRVTVYISEPALDARVLKVAAFRQSGGRSVPVAETENRQLENAILTRARQMRIAAAGR